MIRKRRFLALACVLAVATGVLFTQYRNGSLHHLWDVHVLHNPILDVPHVIELGPQEYGSHAEAKFIVTNRGGGELKLDRFRTACVCEGMERKAGDRFVRLTALTLEPNESAELRLVQQVRGRAGESMRSAVYFRTNDPAQPEGAVIVSISQVSGGVSAIPASVHIGTVPVGTDVRRLINLYDGAIRTRGIKQVVSSEPSRFAVRLLPSDPSTPGREGVHREVPVGRVEVNIDTARPGRIDGEIQVLMEDGQIRPDSIRISGRVEAAVEAVPSTVVLPRSSSDGPLYHCSCLCRSTAGLPLSLKLATAPPGITVTVAPAEEEPSSTRLVTIQVDPEQPAAKSQTQNLIIKLTAIVAGVQHNLEVPVQVLPSSAVQLSKNTAADSKEGKVP